MEKAKDRKAKRGKDKYYEGHGYACKEIERLREKRRQINGELGIRSGDTDGQER